MLRRTVATVLTGALLVAVTGCGPKSDSGDDAGDRAGAISNSQTSASPSQPAASSVAINKSVWYVGMKMTFGTAVAAVGQNGPNTVTVDVLFDNFGPNDHNSNNLHTTLTVDGAPYRGAVERSPMLPGSAKTKANVVFQTGDQLLDLASATITVGNGDEAQPMVSAAPDGEMVDLAPKTVLTGPKDVTFPELKVTISECTLRADDPERGRQAKKGKRLIVCGFNIHNLTNSFFHVYNREFQLKAGDGTTSAATYGTVQELGIGGGASHETSLAWEIPWPSSQTYVLDLAYLGPGGGEKPTAQNTKELPLPLA